MNVATTVAITSSATASSAAAIAANQAREARIYACKALDASYDPRVASVEQKQDYSSCMQVLYPEPSEPLTSSELLAGKVVIGILLLAMVIGLVKGFREDGLPESLLLGLLYVGVTLMCMLALALSALGIKFIFS